MAKKAKRAPGGGRKPQGDFDQLSSSPFSVRMPDYLRKQLEMAAERTGRSAGQELLSRLNDSFRRDYSKGRDPATRALCFVLAELIEKVRREGRPWDKWHTDLFMFRAVRVGFATVLKALEPQGDLHASPILADVENTIKFATGKPYEKKATQYAKEKAAKWKTPERGGNKIAAEILAILYRGNLPEIEQWSRVLDMVKEEDRKAPASLKARAETTHYGMQDAMRDLNLMPEPKKRGK
jgi:hypothetical protein